MSSIGVAELPRSRESIHPVWVRLTHWVNVIAMFLMIGSGWRIYNASPLFPFGFPPAVTLGDGLDGLPGALLWHFAAMWLLVANGATYVALGFLTGCLRPGGISPPGVTTYQEEESRRLFQDGRAVFMRNWPYAWRMSQLEGSPLRGRVGVAAMVRGSRSMGYDACLQEAVRLALGPCEALP